ncbi:MAG: hypothetical protein HOH02_08460 [Oceanospirillaceae bacterium]|jgi:hypothetical protein|nr:hypothetical protein [Oceanospirillaceae bacterium]MBT6077973.1 hypothetical protein [Oceanospirillaceae bacterium]MBT7329427.1 hypothetical protein [Oceanospirillaceae bacterium]
MACKEGIAMVALHSEDARADHLLMDPRGVENLGLVDFRRNAQPCHTFFVTNISRI